MIDKTIKLTAYLVREACGLHNSETVHLEIGAEAVRVMALAAKEESGNLRAEVRRLQDALDSIGNGDLGTSASDDAAKFRRIARDALEPRT